MNINVVLKDESDRIICKIEEHIREIENSNFSRTDASNMTNIIEGHIKEIENSNYCLSNFSKTETSTITDVIKEHIKEIDNLHCCPQLGKILLSLPTPIDEDPNIINIKRIQLPTTPKALNILKHESIVSKQSISWLRKRYFFHSTIRLLPKTVPYILSDIGEGIVDVVVKEWYVKPGDKVAQFDPVCEVQSDKASVTITSRFDGLVEKIHYQVDDVAKVGAPLLNILVPDDHNGDTSPEVAGGTAISQETPDEQTGQTTVHDDMIYKDKSLATPAVRRIARENNINLKEVPSTGKAGRVLKEDILAYLDNKSSNSIKSKETSITPKPKQNESYKEDWTENITGIRKAMVKTMTEAWKIPHFNYADEVDVTELLEFRRKEKLQEKAGVKVTYMPFMLKAVSLALLKYPRLNAQLDESCSQLTIHVNHNVGVAMDTPSGLVVPCIHNVEQRSVIEVARELQRLQMLGQQGRLTREDLTGGTLTLSNIGAIGGTHASPVLLPPQIVIGAICKIQKLPKFDSNGELVGRDIMTVSWSADHRAVDGATVARFSNLFKLYLSTPRLLLEL